MGRYLTTEDDFRIFQEAVVYWQRRLGLNPTVPMKDSGVEWLGKIPAHWSKAPVYARYHIQLGKMLDSKRITGDCLAPYVRNIDVQWDRISVVDLNEMDFSDDDKNRYRLEYGDLLVCEGGEIGRTAIWRGELKECYYQKAIHRLRPKNNCDNSRYFYYIMFGAAKSGLFIATGNPNTIDHLTAEKLRTHRFPFPPRDEQDNIVAFLEKETAKTDGLIAKIQESLDRLKEYRTALISAAVTGKIDVRGARNLTGGRI
jgi:type I restriction enzyme, S subunit